MHKCVGNALSRMDKFTEAEACYREAIRLSPRLLAGHHQRRAGDPLSSLETRPGNLPETRSSRPMPAGFRPLPDAAIVLILDREWLANCASWIFFGKF